MDAAWFVEKTREEGGVDHSARNPTRHIILSDCKFKEQGQHVSLLEPEVVAEGLKAVELE